MPIFRAKHKYIQYCLYILSPASCNGITPVTVHRHLSQVRLTVGLAVGMQVMDLCSYWSYDISRAIIE